MKNTIQTTNTKPCVTKSASYLSPSGFKVKVTYPDKVTEHIRQQKINRMYDILIGVNSTKNEIDDEKNFSAIL